MAAPKYDYNDTLLVSITDQVVLTPEVLAAVAEMATVLSKTQGTRVHMTTERWGSALIIWTPETEESKVRRWLDAEERWNKEQQNA